MDGLVDQDAGRGRTVLTRVEETADDEVHDRLLQVRVLVIGGGRVDVLGGLRRDDRGGGQAENERQQRGDLGGHGALAEVWLAIQAAGALGLTD
ncbi:hypothetical protein [Streptomyces sp. NBC_01618]|uniref:hypothetical protein n=1 Tax=Streptomyces sp. NBC_01618 TaxID=2975900 RepID=UPI00386513DB